MGNFLETLPSAKEVSLKYGISKSSALDLCNSKCYISRMKPIVVAFEDDTEIFNFIKKSSKPIKYKYYNKGADMKNLYPDRIGSPTKIEVIYLESGKKEIFNSQIKACQKLDLQPCTINRCLKSNKPYRKKILFKYYKDIV